jgi:hypothetical protein
MNAHFAWVIAMLTFAGPAWTATKGQLQIPEFAALADKANESVTVTLDSNLLGMAARFLSSEDPEQAKAKKLVSSLTGIYVRNYSFDSDYAYPKGEIEGVRRQLNAPGWSRIVGVVSKKESSNVEVFILADGEKAQGLAIIASEPREFTIVNIVGNIDLEQLHDLEGNFGVPNLELETNKKAPPGKSPTPEKAPAPEKTK